MTDKGQVQKYLRAILRSSANDAAAKEGDSGFQTHNTADNLPPFIDTETEALVLLYLFTALALMSLIGLFCLYWKQIRKVRKDQVITIKLI